jgi:FKBP-type peptidyl-prolyl cis-trans isomerase FklB
MGIADRLFQMKNEKASANLKEGQAFLAANKQKPGVVVLPSGLQYEVITQGSGIRPSAKNKVTCHYHGSLIDGTVFDSSVSRGLPATFPLNMVIKGWTEGLQLMSVGSKWRFFIPPQLAYGDRQTGSDIGPNSTLVFEVELLDVS